MSIALALGIGSAASQFIGGMIEKDQAEKDRKRAVEAMKRLLIPKSETDRRVDRAGDTVYTKAFGELNAGAFSSRGVLNPETLRTLAFAKTAGTRADVEQRTEDQDLAYNRQVKQQIAGAEATPTPGFNPADVVRAGVGGYFAGKQLELSEELGAATKKYMEGFSPKKQSVGEFGNSNLGLSIGRPENKYSALDTNLFDTLQSGRKATVGGFNPYEYGLGKKKKKSSFLNIF